MKIFVFYLKDLLFYKITNEIMNINKMDIIISTPVKGEEEFVEDYKPFQLKFYRIIRSFPEVSDDFHLEYPMEIPMLLKKKYPAPLIYKIQEFLLLEQTTKNEWKEMHKTVMKILDRSFCGDEVDKPDNCADEYIQCSKDIINLVENLVGLAVWIMDTFYSKFGKTILKKPIKEKSNLIAWYIIFDMKDRKKCQFRIFRLEDYLIKASNIKKRIKASNKIKDWYAQYYWEPSRVMNRDSNVNKIKNYQGYYYDIDLIEPDIFY